MALGSATAPGMATSPSGNWNERSARAVSLHASVTIGGQSFPATYAGPQPTIPGLDQVNVALPLSLRGAGLVDVSVAVAGVISNAGQIFIN